MCVFAKATGGKCSVVYWGIMIKNSEDCNGLQPFSTPYCTLLINSYFLVA